MNMPEPSSKPATRVRRGMMLRYQWKYFTQFLFDHLTEHANAKVVVVTESLGKALANLIGNDGRSDQLGV